MKLPKSVVLRIIKEGLEDKKVKVRKESIEYIGTKMEEFCMNVAKNAELKMNLDKMHTLTSQHLYDTLDSLELVLKNIPRAKDAKKT